MKADEVPRPCGYLDMTHGSLLHSLWQPRLWVPWKGWKINFFWSSNAV